MMIKNFIASLIVSSALASALPSNSNNEIQRRQRSSYAGRFAKKSWEDRQQFLNPNNEDTSIVGSKNPSVLTNSGNAQSGQYDSIVYPENVDQTQNNGSSERNYNLPSYLRSQR